MNEPLALDPAGLTLLAPREHTYTGDARPRGNDARLPGRGPGVGLHDRHMDGMAIERVVAGKAKFATLTVAERRETVRRLRLRRMPTDTLARRVGTNELVIRSYVRWIECGVWISPNTPAAQVAAKLAELPADDSSTTV